MRTLHLIFFARLLLRSSRQGIFAEDFGRQKSPIDDVGGRMIKNPL